MQFTCVHTCDLQCPYSDSKVVDFGIRSGEFHDQGDAKWIVIRGKLRGHDDAPFGRPTPSRPIGRLGVFGVFIQY
jgi:hypothetical protein